MKTSRGKLILVSVYFAFIVAAIYAANTQQMFAPISSWLHRTPGADKLCYFLLVGALAVAVNWLLNCRTIDLPRGSIQLGTLICLAFATLEESSQIWIPSRNFDLLDLTMNTLGILVLGPLARKLPVTNGDQA